jgi:hypothetical protein
MPKPPDPLSVIVEATTSDFPSENSETANLPAKIPPKRTAYIADAPRKERPEHKQMYLFYERLGHKRSLRRVAKEFGRSFGTVSLTSRAFGWQQRVRQTDALMKDSVASIATPQMDAARLDIIGVVGEITMILAEMTELSKDIRKKQKDELNYHDNIKMKSLVNALSVYGIKIRTPKDLRDMIGTLKDIMDFNKGRENPMDTPQQNTQVNVKELNLVIKDD